MPSRHDRKGRSKKEGRFVALPHSLLNTPAWRSLSSAARSAYIAVAMLYNGSNNGYLAASARRIGDDMGVTKSTAARALRELVDKGFLEVTAGSAFNMKQRRACEYRLTLCGCDRTGALPSRAFQQWKSNEKQNTVSKTAA